LFDNDSVYLKGGWIFVHVKPLMSYNGFHGALVDQIF